MSSFDSNNPQRSYTSPYGGYSYGSSSSFNAYNSPQAQPLQDRNANPLNPYGSNTGAYGTGSSASGSFFDRDKPAYDPVDNYKQSTNAEFDHYKPAYLKNPDMVPTSYSTSIDGTSYKPMEGRETGRFFTEGTSPIMEDKPEGKTNNPRSLNKVLDPENIRYYHLFNLKRVPYKLKHYLYYSEDLNMDFDVNNYNRMDVKMGRPPRLRHYLRFYDLKYDYEMNPKGKYYGDMYTLSEQSQSSKIISSREYKGKYANQLDFINFKAFMSQEKHH
jgi:hypothetical protein